MRRLLVVASPVFSVGGGLRHAFAVARAASDAGWTTEVIVGCRHGDEGVAELAQTIAPAAHLSLHTGSALRSLSWTLSAVLSWQRGGRGVIYAPFSQAMLLAFFGVVPGRRRRQLIAAFQGTPIPESVARWKRPLYRAGFRRMLSSRTVTVAAVSQAQLDEVFDSIGSGLGRRGTVVGNIAHGTGDAPWVTARDAAASSPSARDPSDPPLAVVLARLSWEKGVDVAIRAAAASTSAVRLLIAGEGPELGALKALTLELGIADRVAFAGWCGTADVLAQASVVLIPSRREGLPAALLEAAWASVPIVASAVGGIPEASKDLPQVTLVPPDDPPALASAIDEVLNRDHTFPIPGLNWEAFTRSTTRLLLATCA